MEERLAARLRDLRSARGLTLQVLAERSGMSVPHLSRLEKGERQPSVAALLQLCRVYGMSLSQIVEDTPTRQYHLVRAGASDRWAAGSGEYSVLSGAGAEFSAVEATYSSSRRSRRASHDGHEWIYVLEGDLRLTIGDEVLELAIGDAVQFTASLPHQIAAGGSSVRILVISTTAPSPH